MSGRLNAGTIGQPWGVGPGMPGYVGPYPAGSTQTVIIPLDLPLPKTPGEWDVTGITATIDLNSVGGDVNAARLDVYLRVGPTRIILFTTSWSDLNNNDSPDTTFVYSGGFTVRWSDTWQLESVLKVVSGFASNGTTGKMRLDLIGEQRP